MKKLVFIFCSLLLLASCAKEELTNEAQNESATEANVKASSVQMLEFESIGDFKTFVAANMEADLLDKTREMAADGFYSLLFIYESNLAELDALRINSEEVAQVHSYDDMLHFFLNQNGEIAIEDKIFRIDGDFVYTYNPGYDGDIDRFVSEYEAGRIRISRGETIEYSENLSVYMHENNEPLESNIAEPPERGVTITDNFANCSGYGFRMRSRQFNGFWGFYSAIGSSTYVQQKKRFWFFGWHYYWTTVKKYNRLHYGLEYHVNVLYGGPDFDDSASGHVYCYCNKAKKTYNWSVGIPVAPYFYTPISGSGETVHWAHEFSCSPDTEHRTIAY